MKSWVALIALAAAVALVQCGVTEEQAAKIAEHRKKCVAETGVDLSEIQELNKGNWSSQDPAVANFVFCMLKAYGFMDEEARFNKVVFVEKIPPTVDHVKVESAIEECLNSVQHTGSDHSSYAFLLASCYYGKGTGYSLL